MVASVVRPQQVAAFPHFGTGRDKVSAKWARFGRLFGAQRACLRGCLKAGAKWAKRCLIGTTPGTDGR
jgi:hypothetical protein